MSLERGGRADKYGNKYENSYLAKLLLRLVQEAFTSVTVEPLGPNSDAVEFIAETKDGMVKHYQCKASNTTHSSWSIYELREHDVFTRAKDIILSGHADYYFISPLHYKELAELCKRARTNSSPEDFKTYQLTNQPIRDTFNDCITEFGYNDAPDAVEKTVFLLSHCYFEQCIFGTEAVQDFEAQIGINFTGKASTARVLLEQYANDTGKYGIKITARDIVDYLDEKGFNIRNYHNDKTVLHRIDTLNNTYWGIYHPIHETLVHRTVSDNILQNIKNGYSVILHGNAGRGKSGCLEEVVSVLRQERILYLAIKLDKHVPQKSADAYGIELGLPESPVYCLATLAAGKKCVLILDQLDALRWTSNHSGDALDVCKELIQQAHAVNQYDNGNISIVFASRTFDLENDKGLQDLFKTFDSRNNLKWARANIDCFTKSEVIQIIGQRYESLSPRLQVLLLTPSSLYVWTRLEETGQKNSISSVYELMSTWWRQIKDKCNEAELTSAAINSCKSKIVEMMETRSVFSLPRSLFDDQTKEIAFLASVGILNVNSSTKNISFTHQSFLDYFMTSKMTSKLLEQIYSGYDLKDLIGEKNCQTPLVRYRLLTVLQNLIESDPTVFAEQSNQLLASSSVRFYFKCTVFEIIGQCNEPAEEILKIVRKYMQDATWSDTISQVVFYGHPAFIIRLLTIPYDNFPSEKVLSLLRSISDKEPDFVTEKLRHFALLDPEKDHKILWALCYDANDDSENMFELRTQLLENNPLLFQNFWGFQDLIKQLSIRAIRLLKIIVSNWPKTNVSELYLDNPTDLTHYVKRYAWEIITELFPEICKTTKTYLPHWPDSRWDYDYQDWMASEYNESAVRKITEIVKSAFAEGAQSFPEKAFDLIESVDYPCSGIGHECIMYAVQNLPVSYADKAVTWLLRDIEHKIFVFSSKENDYLFDAGKIIEKFSPICKFELFRELEQLICNWKESPQRMINRFKDRTEAREKYHTPVYYAYWGHLQKTLLPSMDSSRLSTASKQLLDVVNRNSWISIPYYFSGIISGPMKTVVSPINNYAEQVSDETWLRIISTPNDRMHDSWCGTDDGPYYVEATHEAFSSTLGTQAKQQPLRFAKLALSFPEKCFDDYVYQVLYALSQNSTEDNFDVNLASAVVRRYGHGQNHNIAIAISRILKNHANENWPADILDIIGEIAISRPNPDKGRYNITSNSEPEHKLAHSLLDNSINCACGCAINAIAALLWAHHDLGAKFRAIIESAYHDPNPVVRFAVMSCVFPYYNIDKSFAVSVFNALTETDARIMVTHGYWDILSSEYSHYANYYRQVLIDACKSPVEDLSECAAGFLCAVGIYHNDQEALNFMLSYPFSTKQQSRICLQAISSFNLDDYHEKSRAILMHLIDHSTKELHGFNRLFFDRCIVIQRDEAFLIHLMESRQSVHLFHSFLKYLHESGEDICGFARVLSAIGNSLLYMPTDVGGRLIINDLVKCVVRLFDKGKDDPIICEVCLDLWDKLFMSNLHDIKPLSDMIDNFE